MASPKLLIKNQLIRTMKKTATILILMLNVISYSQELTNWQVGVSLNPFVFSRIISNSNYVKDKQDVPNSFGYGLTLEKNWNEHWGIKTGFESTKQNDKYFSKDTGFNITVRSSFEYYKTPLTIQYYYPLKENLYLTFNQGFQFSKLNYIKSEFNQGDFFYQILTSDYYEVINNKVPSQNKKIFDKQIVYRENLFGIIGSVGLKGFLSKKISYSTNLRYEYDISDSDEIKFEFVGNSTKPIHNFRLGLELGLQYNFSLDHYRFNKSPHKL